MHFVQVRHFVVVMMVVLFSQPFRRLYFFEDFVFLGKSNSSMVSFTFTISAMTWQPPPVVSQSPKINFLISCPIKFGVLRFVSGASDHFEHVVVVLLGVLLRNLLLDLLQDLMSVPERFGSWERLSFVDLRSQRTGSATM